MPKISFEVVKAMRIKNPLGRTGKIMVQRLLGLLGINPAFAKQQAEKFLVFRVHAEDGIGRLLVFGTVAVNDLELSIALGMFAQRKHLERFAASQAMTFEKLRHHCDTDAKTSPQEFLGDLRA